MVSYMGKRFVTCLLVCLDATNIRQCTAWTLSIAHWKTTIRLGPKSDFKVSLIQSNEMWYPERLKEIKPGQKITRVIWQVVSENNSEDMRLTSGVSNRTVALFFFCNISEPRGVFYAFMHLCLKWRVKPNSAKPQKVPMLPAPKIFSLSNGSTFIMHRHKKYEICPPDLASKNSWHCNNTLSLICVNIFSLRPYLVTLFH